MYQKNAPLLPPSIIERAKKLDVAQLCDGVKASGINILKDGCMESAMLPVHRSMRVVGTAMTIETQDGDNFPIHVATYRFSAAGYVMVIDGKGYTDRAYLGDLILSANQAMSLEGVVLDGCARDRNGIIDMHYPVFCKGLMPASPIKESAGGINCPILCGGVKVNPGDLIVGDYDGVCVVPREHVELVLDKAEEKARYELKRRETIRTFTKARAAGTQPPELAPQWVLDLIEKMSL